ncbi:MAG TPA: hypothetical protein VNN79_17325 [Actinomycetota bacterium]|nr:hypothetical protein [Actinomycetota bacterium]
MSEQDGPQEPETPGAPPPPPTVSGIPVTFTGSVHGDTMSGRYATTQGDTGTWQATRA